MSWYLLHLRAVSDCATGARGSQYAFFISQDFKIFPFLYQKNTVAEVNKSKGYNDPSLEKKAHHPTFWGLSEVQAQHSKFKGIPYCHQLKGETGVHEHKEIIFVPSSLLRRVPRGYRGCSREGLFVWSLTKLQLRSVRIGVFLHCLCVFDHQFHLEDEKAFEETCCMSTKENFEEVMD